MPPLDELHPYLIPINTEPVYRTPTHTDKIRKEPREHLGENKDFYLIIIDISSFD